MTAPTTSTKHDRVGEHLQFELSVQRHPRPRGLDVHLANDWHGFKPEASERDIWEHNRGCWYNLRLDLRGLVTFEHGGRVICVADVTGIEVIEHFEGDHEPDARRYVNRRLMRGNVLVGHPWVGTECSHVGNQNAWTWQPDPTGAWSMGDRSALSKREVVAPIGSSNEPPLPPCGLPFLHGRRLCGCFD